MNTADLKQRLRAEAESHFHERLHAIEAEVDLKFSQYQAEVAVINEAEDRTRRLFEDMRQAVAVRYGLQEESSPLGTNLALAATH